MQIRSSFKELKKIWNDEVIVEVYNLLSETKFWTNLWDSTIKISRWLAFKWIKHSWLKSLVWAIVDRDGKQL